MSRFRSIDLNLIVILECLYRHLNVSSAARELGMTQSALSHSLAKLRSQFNDPIFVRIAKGVAPTDFARSIRKEVEDFVSRANGLTQKVHEFDPATSTETIVITCTDYLEIVIGAELMARLRKEAPGIRLTFRPLIGGIPKESLESGDCDLAFASYFTEIPEGYYRQKLFTDRYAVAYRKNHPKIEKSLKAKTYYECNHARLTVWRDSNDSFSRNVDGKKMIRKLSYTSGSFSTMFLAVSRSDLVLTAPSSIVQVYKNILPIQAQECPFSVPAIEVQMVWHGITHRNPLQQWFRKILREVSMKVEQA